MKKRRFGALLAAGMAAGLLLVMLLHSTAGPRFVPTEIRVRTQANAIWNGTVELVGGGQVHRATTTRNGAVHFKLPAGTFQYYQARLLTPDGNEQWAGRVWVLLPHSVERVSATVQLDRHGKPSKIIANVEYRP
jgi:hypothetical protein